MALNRAISHTTPIKKRPEIPPPAGLDAARRRLGYRGPPAGHCNGKTQDQVAVAGAVRALVACRGELVISSLSAREPTDWKMPWRAHPTLAPPSKSPQRRMLGGPFPHRLRCRQGLGASKRIAARARRNRRAPDHRMATQ